MDFAWMGGTWDCEKKNQIESLLSFFDLSLFHDMNLAFDALNQP